MKTEGTCFCWRSGRRSAGADVVILILCGGLFLNLFLNLQLSWALMTSPLLCLWSEGKGEESGLCERRRRRSVKS